MRRLRIRRWGQWTLRSRMVVSIVALAGVALIVVNIVAATLIRGYLTDKLDTELTRFGGGGPRPDPEQQYDPTRTGDGQFRGLPAWAQEGVAFIRYDATGTKAPWGNFGSVTSTELPILGDFQELKTHAGQAPFTAVGTKASYRVAVMQNADNTGKVYYSVSARSMDKIEQTANQLMLVGMGVSGLALLVLALLASAVVKIGLRPLTRMETAAASIAADDPPSQTQVAGRVPDADPHTEAGRLGLALNTMLGRIQNAIAARAASEQRLRQFLADASHELRTPLTSIRGFAELYRRSGSQGGPEMTEMMSRIEQEAARMGLLVEDLLLLAALDEERPLRAQPVDLLAVAADTISDAHVRNPTRFVALSSFDPVTVTGDDHRLRQVATNLVSNALRHTGDFAKVEIRVAETTMTVPDPAVVASVGADLRPGTRIALLEVGDTGPGVPAEHAERIFERLYRADPGRARSQGGSGLGLSIVAAIVAAHGGRVELVTAPGQGATFRVLLPLGNKPSPHP
ncbi:sensor histidine kinase [Hamadaea tsunoensis]|uniref:sensor histidine kinase n=1 Tax=Hamadaea tsunoensis TaxID=53368 RepID=UPI0004006DFE|nr:HAMP domain-containing sensor histidine kinase [Hamadaea tsunoensis]